MDWDKLPADALWEEFARRLRRAMNEKGWNQSELARRASDVAPDGVSIGRDLVSNYLSNRKKTIPQPHGLKCIADALGVSPSDLLPTRASRRMGENWSPGTPIEVKDAGEDFAWVRVNQRVPWPVALQIMNLVKGAQ